MKRKIVTILAYTLLVVVVLFMSQCEHSVTLTTVKRDARHIIELAERIESEEELKHVEKLARQYEIGYQRMYNGAKALEFKRLTNDALREAGEVCNQIHAENERIAAMRNTFHSSLQDLEAAWGHDISSLENDIAAIEQNNEQIGKIEADIESVKRESEKLYDLIIEKNYPEDLLNEHSELNNKIVEMKAEIGKIEHQNHIIRLAYKLHGVEFPADESEEPIEELTEEATEEIVEESTEEVTENITE
jgi:hypothetical protein